MSSHFYCGARHHMACKTFWSAYVSCPSCVPAQPLAYTQLTDLWGRIWKKVLMLWDTSTLLATNTEHRTKRAAMGKVNLTPARPSIATQRRQVEWGWVQVTSHWIGQGNSTFSSDLNQVPSLTRLWEAPVPCCDIHDRGWCELCLGFCKSVCSRQPQTNFPGCVKNISILERVLKSALQVSVYDVSQKPYICMIWKITTTSPGSETCLSCLSGELLEGQIPVWLFCVFPILLWKHKLCTHPGQHLSRESYCQV